MKVYVETTPRRTFACAVDWPGLCRAGKTEEDALDALIAYGSRYAKAIGKAAARFEGPAGRVQLRIVERLAGNASTDFGVPGVIPDVDREEVPTKELERLLDLVQACWRAFDRVATDAHARTLKPAGPRGGGRALEKVVRHVAEAEGAYVRALGGKPPESDWPEIQEEFIAAARARARGELPERGPRGGQRWPAPFAIRRSAWHALDHAWEIEDRVAG